MNERGRGRRPERPQPADIEVRMDEFKIGGPRESLSTEGLGPCAGITFDHRATQRGAMGHFPDYSRGEVASLAQEFFDEVGADPTEVRAYLRGASPAENTARFEEYSEAVREEAKKGVIASGIPLENTNIVWQNDSTRSASMRLDTVTGKFTSTVDED